MMRKKSGEYGRRHKSALYRGGPVNVWKVRRLARRLKRFDQFAGDLVKAVNKLSITGLKIAQQGTFGLSSRRNSHRVAR